MQLKHTHRTQHSVQITCMCVHGDQGLRKPHAESTASRQPQLHAQQPTSPASRNSSGRPEVRAAARRTIYWPVYTPYWRTSTRTMAYFRTASVLWEGGKTNTHTMPLGGSMPFAVCGVGCSCPPQPGNPGLKSTWPSMRYGALDILCSVSGCMRPISRCVGDRRDRPH